MEKLEMESARLSDLGALSPANAVSPAWCEFFRFSRELAQKVKTAEKADSSAHEVNGPKADGQDNEDLDREDRNRRSERKNSNGGHIENLSS